MKQIIIISQIIVIALVLVLVFFIQTSYADTKRFTDIANFEKDSRVAEENKLPILVLFSSIYCDYCQYIKDEFLAPMIKSGDYHQKVVITVVEDDVADDVIDFSGKEIDSGNFSDRYNIKFTPTIVFVDYRGKEVAERIIGLGNVDFFGGDLDNGIEMALKETQSNSVAIR